MRLFEFTNEDNLGTAPKRSARKGSRPARGHNPEPRYKNSPGISKDKETEFHAELDKLVHNTFGKRQDESGVGTGSKKVDEHKKGVKAVKYSKKPKKPVNPSEVAAKAKAKAKADAQKKPAPPKPVDAHLGEHGKASLALCKSSKPDEDLGASMLASCKSQGLRARDGNKSHKLGKSAKSRVKVGGHKIKGQKYGGPLPDWS